MKETTKDKIYKRSRQRERILELLQSTGVHPTADWIYERLKDEFPHLSMGTIYRNLSILIDQGLISKIDFGSTFDRFDANIDEHYHFICEKCGAIIDLQVPVDHSLEKKLADKTQLTVKSHRIEFFGLCEECRKKEEQEQEAKK